MGMTPGPQGHSSVLPAHCHPVPGSFWGHPCRPLGPHCATPWPLGPTWLAWDMLPMLLGSPQHNRVPLLRPACYSPSTSTSSFCLNPSLEPHFLPEALSAPTALGDTQPPPRGCNAEGQQTQDPRRSREAPAGKEAAGGDERAPRWGTQDNRATRPWPRGLDVHLSLESSSPTGRIQGHITFSAGVKAFCPSYSRADQEASLAVTMRG